MRAGPVTRARAFGDTVAGRARALGPEFRPILHTALGAAAAWLIATEVLGHASPFFAPIAAVITLGLTAGERLRRAIEITVGVAVGIVVADALVIVIGPGALALALVTGLAIVVVRLLGGGPLVASQAAISAVLVATIQPPAEGFAFDRALDALAGSATGLLVGTLILPIDPVAALRRALGPVFTQLADALSEIAGALNSGEPRRASEALAMSRDTEPALAGLREATLFAEERGRLSVSVRAAEEPGAYLTAAREAELAVRNARVLARSAGRLIRLGDPIPPALPGAASELAAAAAAARRGLADEREWAEARHAAARAARRANAALDETATMAALHLVGQLRLTAFDLLRALGVPDTAALEAVRGEPGEDTREFPRAG